MIIIAIIIYSNVVSAKNNNCNIKLIYTNSNYRAITLTPLMIDCYEGDVIYISSTNNSIFKNNHNLIQNEYIIASITIFLLVVFFKN